MKSLSYLWDMNETNTQTMNNPTLTYAEVFCLGNCFSVTYNEIRKQADARFVIKRTDFLTVLDTQTTRNGLIAAKFKNSANGEVFWSSAKGADTICERMPIGKGLETKLWVYEGKR